MFPIPKNLRIKNKVSEIEIIRPLLVFAKMVAEEKRLAKKKIRKNIGITPKVVGSTK